MRLQQYPEYKDFENSLKKLILSQDSDIIDINIFAKKSTNNLEIKASKKESMNTILK
jgi:hypothetical protein